MSCWAVESTPTGLWTAIDDARGSGPASGQPVHLHAVALVHVAGGIAHELAVDTHAPRDDQRLGGAPGSDAGVGEVLGEAHWLQR